MARSTNVSLLRRELDRVNREIDRKIIRGQSYQQESMYHKRLLSRIRMQSRGSIFGRLRLAFF